MKYITYIHTYIIVVTILLSLSSCEKIDDGSNTNSLKHQENASVINGRFFFSSKNALKTTIEKFKKSDLTTIEDKFESLYNKGFRSKTAMINPKNETLKRKLDNEYLSNQKNASKSSEIPDEEEDNSIGDSFFAAIVNENNEIIVGDSLYKIVKDLGVLSVKVKDSTHLYDYLNKLNTNTSKTARMPIDVCEMQTEYGGYTQINPQISRYIAPAEGNCGSTVSPAPVAFVPQISPEEQLQNQINNLSVCEFENTSLFQTIFGTNKACINYFDSRHRIKTEFWNQSWGIYSSIGIQVRTQVKTLGIWWASDADEIHLGINKVLLKYNYKAPQIETYNPSTSNPLPPIYMYNNNYQLLSDNGNFSMVNMSSGTGLPFFTFNSDNILNIYIRQLPDPNYQINSESNIKQLYKLGINFLKQNFNSGAKQDFVVTNQKSDTEIEVVYFGERYKKTNTNKIEKKFDGQFLDFLVGYSSNMNSSAPSSNNPDGSTASNNFSLKIEKGANFRDYTSYELDFYGLGRRGNTWSGSRVNKFN
ncbi:MAG: hypothetical protein ABI793_05415 [Flavobacterium sp.]